MAADWAQGACLMCGFQQNWIQSIKRRKMTTVNRVSVLSKLLFEDRVADHPEHEQHACRFLHHTPRHAAVVYSSPSLYEAAILQASLYPTFDSS